MFVFSPNMEKYGPEKTLCLDNFHAVLKIRKDFWSKKKKLLSNYERPCDPRTLSKFKIGTQDPPKV